jgi:thiol-disulfide isomerase/thioredoxin
MQKRCTCYLLTLIFSIATLAIIILKSPAITKSNFKTITADQLQTTISSPDRSKLIFIFASWYESCREKLIKICQAANKYKNIDFILQSIDKNSEKQQVFLKKGIRTHADIQQLKYPETSTLLNELGNIGINFRGAVSFVALFDNKNKKLKYQHISIQELDLATQEIL